MNDKSDEPSWKTFEREICAELVSLYPEAEIRYDALTEGYLSGTKRQIDVLIEENLASGVKRTAVDAKYRARRIDVKEVESFIGLLRDTRVERGVIVSSSGYTEAALTRAFRDDIDIDLDVVTLDEFKQWQAACAIPYAGDNAVLLPAPFGWAVDGERRTGSITMLYQRGLTWDEAGLRKEFMYVNFWSRRPPVDSLDALLAKQEREIRAHSPDAIISLRSIPTRYGPAYVRRADILGYPTAEITGFVEFEDFVFFCVLFSPLAVERRNVRKLEYLLQKIMPIKIKRS